MTNGIKKVEKFLKSYAKTVDSIVTEGLEDGGRKILSESNRIAPVDTGNLIRNTEVEKTIGGEVQVRYHADYAMYVHEDLEARHPKGHAKFLEKATNQEGHSVIRRIAQRLRRAKA